MKLVSLFDEIVARPPDKVGNGCYSTLVGAEKEILDAVVDCRGRDYENCLTKEAGLEAN
jgi:hypothetical protein